MKSKIWALLSLLMVPLLLVGCSSGASSTESGSTTEVKTIYAGSMNNFAPQAYLDDSGNPTGFEFDLFKAIDEKLPQYELQLEAMDFTSLTVALDSSKIDVASSCYNKSAEREAKYLFGDEPYMQQSLYLMVLADDTDIQSIEDLAGSKVNGTNPNSTSYKLCEEWNNAHPDKAFVLEGAEDDSAVYEVQLAEMQAGVYRAKVTSKSYFDQIQAATNNAFRLLEAEPLGSEQYFQLFRQDETELQEAFDGALKELREDGTLDEITTKWYGEGVWDVLK